MKSLIRFSSVIALLIILMNCSSDSNIPDQDPSNPIPTEAATTLINTLSVPWELYWGPDNFLWVTERNGKISRIDPDTGTQQELINIAAVERIQESGLLGMVLHPNFTTDPFVYVAYTYLDGNDLKERLVRFTYENNSLVNETILLDDITASGVHNGSRLLITPDLHLLMTTGDAGNTNLSQNMNSLNGKILRLRLDGTIPGDNPFTNNYIYSLGHRNAQGLTQLTNGTIYISEHGPNTDDEINRIVPGANYGWPNVRGVIDTQNEQEFANTTPVVESIYHWTPTIATSDLIYYTGDRIPQWKNKLIMSVLKEQRLVALTLSPDGSAITNEEVFFDGIFGRIRDIAVSPNGRVFIATNGNSYSDTGNTHRIIEIHKVE